jgi:CelD/BcsL family acetyltransferase involved in cellulose biosynthesis
MFQAHHEHRDVSPLVDLSTGYEAYRSDRQAAGSRVLTETARKDRKLAREVAPVEFSPHVADASVLGQVMAWKSEQYRRTGLVDLFGFRWARELVERIMHTSSERFSGMLSVLRAGDRLVAAHMGMRSLGVWHWWFPTYDHEYARYSPGAILLMRTIERACESGLSQVDLGKGDDEYKQRFANAAVDLAEGSVIVGPWRRAMRTVGQRGWQAMRRSPLRAVGRAPARVLRRVRRWWALR